MKDTAVSSESETFNAAMDRILKVPGAEVKAALEADKRERARQRKAKRAASVRASSESG